MAGCVSCRPACTEKVLKKLGYQLSPEDIDALVNAHQGVIEQVLYAIQSKVRTR